MSSKISKNCLICSNTFEIQKKEYNRQVKNGRDENHFFCSLSCAASHRNKVHPHTPSPQWGNQFAKKGEFTAVLNRARQRKRVFNLTEEYLQNLWNEQDGKCNYTNIPLLMNKRNSKQKPNTASLDRIDSNIGYVEGNVQFICYSLNLAKASFSHDEFSEWIHQL